MNDCYYEKKDWRLCKNEVSLGSFPNLAIFHSTSRVSARTGSFADSRLIYSLRCSEDVGSSIKMIRGQR